MSQTLPLLGIAMALVLGAASPGPSFLMVARTAASGGRRQGLQAALGMGFGAVLFAVASLVGLKALFQAVPSLFLALKLLGGAYLAWLGLRLWRGATMLLAVDAAAHPSHSRQMTLGFATQVSNPKTAIVYASVFAAFLPPDAGLGFASVVVAIVFAVEAGWYAAVALLLSSSGPRRAYLRWKASLDRTAGAVMGALGLRLAASTLD